MKPIPLNALRAFEAAARTGSFVAAARELGVTAAAVSQQVHQLEDYWQRKLFRREGNRIALTDAGMVSGAELAQLMDRIAQLSEGMQRRVLGTEFVLSAPHSVAETWLPERLAQGAAACGPLRLRVEEDPVDFARDRIALRVYYGAGLYPQIEDRVLFVDEFVPVAAPPVAARIGHDLAGAQDTDLIHTDWGAGYATGPEFARLFARRIDVAAGQRVPFSSLARRWAEAGLGVALMPLAMVTHPLAAGRLVRLRAPEMRATTPYSVAWRPSRGRAARLATVLRALGLTTP